MSLPQALRERRREQGETQAEAAAKLGVGQQSVAKWELGTTRPRKRPQIEAIAAYLGIDYKDALVLVYEESVGADRLTIMEKLDQVIGRVDDVAGRLKRVEELVGASAGAAPGFTGGPVGGSPRNRTENLWVKRALHDVVDGRAAA